VVRSSAVKKEKNLLQFSFILLKDICQAIKMRTRTARGMSPYVGVFFSGSYKNGKKESDQEESQEEKIGLRIVQTV